MTRRRILLAAAAILSIAAMLHFWRSPSHDRDWKQAHAVLPHALFEGQRVTVHDIRDFRYGPGGSVTASTYRTKTFDLTEISEIWYGISYFSEFEGLAHTFVSFGFTDGEYLVVSIEARQERDESYSPLLGLLRKYELIYVVASERDAIGLRTHVRDTRVHLFPLKVAPGDARTFLYALLERANEIHQRAAFYNTRTDNCTTGLFAHARDLAPLRRRLDYRILFPGYSDRLLHEMGLLAPGRTLDQARRAARIDPRSTRPDDPDFSRKIRGRAGQARSR